MFDTQRTRKCNSWTLMCSVLAAALCVTFAGWLVLRQSPSREEDAYLSFPDGFSLGASGSSYQIEGAWNTSGKGESVYDRFTHTQPWEFANGSNGDVACDFYHKYKEDVQWMKKLRLDHYRLSISWARVLPTGSADSINLEGLRFYHNLIDELIANDVEPIVTLFHWDLPQVLEDMGGWTNESMVTWFTDYANVIFRELGPKVKVFTTINEPRVYCFDWYATGNYSSTMRWSFLCGNNILKAHAQAYRLYDREYRPTQHGQVGLATACEAFLPKNANETLASEMSFQYTCGSFSHAIYIGDYSDVYKAIMAKFNRDVDSQAMRVPELSPEWIEYIKGTTDYFGLNHYGTLLVELGEVSGNSFVSAIDVKTSYNPGWKMGFYDQRPIVPEGFSYVLRKIKEEYNNPPVYVLENGMVEREPVNDVSRVEYLYSYLKELLLAVNRDGCNVQKYTTWSFMDDFEWRFGYELPTMGLMNVNFSSPNRDRRPKLSYFWFGNVIRNRRLQPRILPRDNSIEQIPTPFSL